MGDASSVVIYENTILNFVPSIFYPLSCPLYIEDQVCQTQLDLSCFICLLWDQQVTI